MDIKIACYIEGHEKDYISLDTSRWTLAEFEQFGGQFTLHDGMLQVRQDSTDWHITGDDGIIVPFPGRLPTDAEWLGALRQIGTEGYRLIQWLGTIPALAVLERLTIAKKSDSGDMDSD